MTYAIVNLCKTATLKLTKNWFSKLIIALCRSKVLQNAPRAILSTFIKLSGVIRSFCLFLSGRFTQVLLYISFTGSRSKKGV